MTRYIKHQQLIDKASCGRQAKHEAMLHEIPGIRGKVKKKTLWKLDFKYAFLG